MAIKKLRMMNAVCERSSLDAILSELITDGNCGFIDAFLEIDEGDFSIGIAEENADRILDMEDITPLVENKKLKRVSESFDDLMKAIQYTPNIIHETIAHDVVVEQVITETEAFCEAFSLKRDTLKQLEERLDYLKRLKVLECAKHIEIDFKRLVEMNFFTMKFGYLTREKAKRISQNYDHIKALVFHIGTAEEKELYMIISPKSLDLEMSRILRSTDFYELNIDSNLLDTPKNMLMKIEMEIERNLGQQQALQDEMGKGLEPRKAEIDRLMTQLTTCSKVNEIKRYVAVTEELAYFAAWVPEASLTMVTSVMNGYRDALVTFKHQDEVSQRIQTPTLMVNHWFFRPFETLIKMYGVPSHTELDPTPFFGVAYILMFGAMFGDLGQGLVISLAGLILSKRGGHDMGGVLVRIGFGAMLFGVLYDSFFGYENLISRWLPIPIYLRPIENIMTILLLSIIMGLILVYISLVYGIINKLRQGDYQEGLFGRNGINGAILLSALLLYGYGVAAGTSLISNRILLAVMLLCVTLLLIKQPLSRFISKEEHLYEETLSAYYVEAGFDIFETLLSMLSNTASFIRIGAFALNHVGLFIAFHTLSEMIGTTFGNILMFILGNAIIIGLEGLVVFIQGLRLFYYELFSKYYLGEGILFEPDHL